MIKKLIEKFLFTNDMQVELFNRKARSQFFDKTDSLSSRITDFYVQPDTLSVVIKFTALNKMQIV